jgi:hypothetical protein
MRKNKLVKRLKNLGFSDKMIAVFGVFEDYFEMEPVVMPCKFGGVSMFFKWKDMVFNGRRDFVLNESSVEKLENVLFDRMKRGNMCSILTMNNDGTETRRNLPPFSTANELKLKLELMGFDFEK